MIKPLEIITRFVAEPCAKQIVDELSSEGFVIVPMEPTKKMLAVWYCGECGCYDWKDMIEAWLREESNG